ncbi:Ribosomal protein L15, bacterial-type [Moorella glycerini]|uniref:Large ribosomal subunit protein uL15 n=2 Tax=Neomoorella TaxID=44260 RepID=A0A9X7J111_9FIRM|nr:MULTISPECIES: 50S ribosomal protein L15 [Moorella]KYH33673.1 50S ribosomal protein L15 [Moorella mulderi DSM 14980]PRR70625.1 50S ribosomal protein L15 [Moorella stamsii]CEP68026.1 Ribosomal protein L15, bacterial-type [Moorella glycerini]
MRLHELHPAPGSRIKATRVGRGIGSGLGKTSGRGHKGQKARSGGGVRRGFEGGQMPLSRRLPKRGFTNKFARQLTAINVGELERFEPDTVVTPEVLARAGLVKQARHGVKILGDGELTKPLTVRVQAASRQAIAKIEAAGGKVEVM